MYVLCIVPTTLEKFRKLLINSRFKKDPDKHRMKLKYSHKTQEKFTFRVPKFQATQANHDNSG